MEIILETPRLILRKTGLSDVGNMMGLNSDPLVVKYTGDGPFNSIQQAESIVQYLLDQYKNYGYGRWMLELKNTSEFIGWCGLKYYPEDNIVDLGYRLLQKHWGKGYATEASSSCITYGFETLGLTRITAHAMKENTASIKVLEKTGMKFFEEKIIDEKELVFYEITKNN